MVEKGINFTSEPVRIAIPDTPAPASRSLEKVYYPTYKNIVSASLKMMRVKTNNKKR